MKPIFYTITLLLLTLFHPHRSHAHNGAVAIAVPVEGITADGDLSDWSEGMREYEIRRQEGGDQLVSKGDFRGVFRVGYNEQEMALYVAVDVEDNSVVRESLGGNPWDAQDGCAIFVDVMNQDERAAPLQHILWGDNRYTYFRGERVGLLEDAQVEAQWSEEGYRFEWKIDIGSVGDDGASLRDQKFIGFDIALWDRDEDGSRSYRAWGPGDKVNSVAGIGFVWLSENAMELGHLKGKIQWEDMVEGVRLGKVRIQSLTSEELWAEVKTDFEGVYEVDLPMGKYQVEAGYRRSMMEVAEVVVQKGQVVSTEEVFLPRPPLVGRVVPAGDGITRTAGSGHRQGVWQTFVVTDGLLNNWVRSIQEDSLGQLWMATVGGVSRYDGTTFTTFTTEDGLPHNDVWPMLVDSSGDLWFGTYGGVSRYNGESFTTFTTEDGLLNNGVRSIQEDSSGDLWFGTYGGVSRYNGESFTTFTTEDGLASNAVSSIFEDSSGDLWFGTWGNGVSRYDGETFTTFTTEDGLPHNGVYSISEDDSENIWFGTLGGGISRYDREEFTTFATEDGLGGNGVLSVFRDGSGNMWFGTGDGVSRYDGTTFTTFTTEDGLPHNVVHSIFEDSSGDPWFGTEGGLSRYDGTLTTFTTENGLAHNTVRSIMEDGPGNLWFGTDGGVSRYDGTTFTTFTIEDGLPHNDVRSMLVDGSGDLWVGTKGGVSRYDGRMFTTTFTTENGLAHNTVWSIMEDGPGNLWFGTGGGVSRYDGRTLATYTTRDGLANGRVMDIVEGQLGHLWFGVNSGVSRYDGDIFTTFTTEDGLVSNRVFSILEDGSGNLWFGTGEGVSRYDGQTFTTLTTVDGLAGNAVFSIVEDQLGNLWFGTWGGGVSRYDGHLIQSLTRHDGLGGNMISSILQDRRGDMWIATDGGITRYRPNRVPPPIYLTNIIADRAYGPANQISVPSSQVFVTIEFLGISYKTRREQMAYVYRLEGHDVDWQQTRNRQVTYNDLPEGEYVFQVKAVDRDLNYSKEPATVKVIVHPPYGQFALWGGLGITLIGFFIASGYGIKRKRERNQAREQLVQELEEELQTAHDMQMGLMPKESPKISGFDVSGRCLPANHVGGDFFQYFSISDNRLAITLADVTGHAMEAAVPVLMFSGILDTQMEAGDSLENLFAKLNRSLHRNLGSRTFVCFTVGELNIITRKFRLSNGGCPYPYHYQASTGKITELQVDGYPLGVRADTTYPVIEAQVDSGDRIVFCSDGIIEAENLAGEIFGFEQTAETIKEGCSRDLTAPQLLDYLINEVKQFTQEVPQGDDQTVVILAVEA